MRPHTLNPTRLLNPLHRAAMQVMGSVAPSATATWLERAILRPGRKSSAGNGHTLLHGRIERIPYGSGWLSAWSQGDGPTVILLHGWGRDRSAMEPLIPPLLDAGYRVVAYDAPSHGLSSGTRTNLVECAGAVLQVAGRYGPVHSVVAHSFGGATAAYALRHGLRVHRLALLAAPADTFALTHRLVREMGFPTGVSRMLRTRIERRLSVEADETTAAENVAAAGIQTLVVHDQDDRRVPFGDGERIATAPGARLVSTEGLGHSGILRDETVMNHLLDFIGQ